MFEHFTEGAIKVIMVAQEEARLQKQSFVGSEHIILGLISQRWGIPPQALKAFNVNPRPLKEEIIRYVGYGKSNVNSSIDIPFTPRTKRMLEAAYAESKDMGAGYVGPEHLLLSICHDSQCVASVILTGKFNVELSELRYLTLQLIDEQEAKLARERGEDYRRRRIVIDSDTPALDEFADDLTLAAVDGELDPVLGREEEILDIIATLGRRTKNAPVLVGEPGVGKSAVVEGLAQSIINGNVPPFLSGATILSLDLSSILAGTKYRGEFEERLKFVVEEMEDNPQIVVLIDEIHNLVGAGAAEGAVDAANILKPALARGRLRLVGATTKEEYKKYIERDPALERRFQPIKVEEPTIDVAIRILIGVASKLQEHHGLIYDREALEAAVKLSSKYIPDRFLPDKAIDVIDEAGSRVRLENRLLPTPLKKVISELQSIIEDKNTALLNHQYDLCQIIYERELEIRTQISVGTKNYLQKEKRRRLMREDLATVVENDIANVIGRWTGIPVNKISGSESERLLKMEAILHDRIIGQHQAVVSVSNAIRRARVGLRNPNRPIASFIFAGPTGVGKTELTKAVASHLFNSEENMVRLDMSEYMEKHTVAKLIGSPPGYVGYNEGGQLTEAVRTKPYCVVLLDEVEKAHPDVFNLLLQILDDGRLTDSRGKVIKFNNALIVMTTNLGSKIIETESGIKSADNNDLDLGLRLYADYNLNTWEPPKNNDQDTEIIRKINKLVKDEMKGFFRPEFLNRIDEIIIFTHLTKHDIWDIAEIMLKQLSDRLAEKELNLIVTKEVQSLLVEKGYDPIYGARPLRRVIMQYVEDQIAERFLSEKFKPGLKLTVKRKNFKQFKKDLIATKPMDEIRKLLANTIIFSARDNTERPIDRHEYLANSSLYKSDKYQTDEGKYEHLTAEFRTPLRMRDEDLLTDTLMIDIEEQDAPIEQNNVTENVHHQREKQRRQMVIDIFNKRVGEDQHSYNARFELFNKGQERVLQRMLEREALEKKEKLAYDSAKSQQEKAEKAKSGIDKKVSKEQAKQLKKQENQEKKSARKLRFNLASLGLKKSDKREERKQQKAEEKEKKKWNFNFLIGFKDNIVNLFRRDKK